MHDTLFKILVEKYSGLVLNVALRILGNTDSARDVHQEVFLAIWRRWGSFKSDTNWRGYLYRVTVRKSVEFLKKFLMTPGKEWHDNYSTSQERPDTALLAKELCQKLMENLANLPKRQAEVFVLSRIEGLSYEEIAEVLSCSQATVRVHLHRALNRLAYELKDYTAELRGKTEKCTKR